MNKRDKRLSSYHCAEYSSVTCVQQFVLSERIERLSRYLANFANVFIQLDSVDKHVFSGDNMFVVYCPISNLESVKTVWACLSVASLLCRWIFLETRRHFSRFKYSFMQQQRSSRFIPWNVERSSLIFVNERKIRSTENILHRSTIFKLSVLQVQYIHFLHPLPHHSILWISPRHPPPRNNPYTMFLIIFTS